MKKHHTRTEWLALIEEFEQSGLSQVKFCADRGLNARYFSLRRKKLKAGKQSGAFVQAKPASAEVAEVVLRYGSVTLHLPANNTQGIVQLVKALSA